MLFDVKKTANGSVVSRHWFEWAENCAEWHSSLCGLPDIKKWMSKGDRGIEGAHQGHWTYLGDIPMVDLRIRWTARYAHESYLGTTGRGAPGSTYLLCHSPEKAMELVREVLRAFEAGSGHPTYRGGDFVGFEVSPYWAGPYLELSGYEGRPSYGFSEADEAFDWRDITS